MLLAAQFPSMSFDASKVDDKVPDTNDQNKLKDRHPIPKLEDDLDEPTIERMQKRWLQPDSQHFAGQLATGVCNGLAVGGLTDRDFFPECQEWRV